MSFFPVFLLLLFLLIILDYHKRKKLILQIRRMPSEEKSDLLQKLIDPYGLSYLPLHDLFIYPENAWLQKSGCCPADTAGSNSSDQGTLPIYFDHNEKTWLIRLKKGQYGIYFGGEIGYTVLTTLSLPKTGIQPDLQVCRSLNSSICP